MRRLPYSIRPDGARLMGPFVVLSVIVGGETFALSTADTDKRRALAVLKSDVSHALGEPVELYEETK